MRPSGYKSDEFIHFIYCNGEKREVKGDKKRSMPKQDLVEVSFSEIETMNLNNKGKSISYARNNVVNVERYMLWYWSPIIGSNAIMLFLHLWEYCNQDEGVDICYPKISELCEKMNVSRPTLIKILNKLEENNFILQIHRLNKKNNMKETSPIFKLRQTIPLLSKEQYNQLSNNLQKKHDDYMEKFSDNQSLDHFSYNAKETKEELKLKGDLIVSKKARKEIDDIIEADQDMEYLLSILPPRFKETLKQDEWIDELEKCSVSKPMRDVFFTNTATLFDGNLLTAHIVAKDESSRDCLAESSVPHIDQKIRSALENLYGQVSKIEYYTVKEYIIKIKKGN